MKRINAFFKNFLKDEEGMEMVEYAIVAALAIIGAAAAWVTLGGNIVAVINALAGKVSVPT